MAIISKVKTIIYKLHRVSPLKSFQLRLILVVLILGLIPSFLIKTVILGSYESKAVEVRTADIKNQCTILCNELSNVDYLSGSTSDVIEAQITLLSNVYNGRVMIVDDNYQILEDSYDNDAGKCILSENVIKCFAGENTSSFDAENHYIDITSPIYTENGEVQGVVCFCASTDNITDIVDILNDQAEIILLALDVVIIVLACTIGYLMIQPFKRLTSSFEAIGEGYESTIKPETAYLTTIRITEAANKMLARMKLLDQSKDEFVSNVSHELKTPLTSMKVLADTILLTPDVPADMYREFMEDISHEIERENDIITDLLALVKLDKSAASSMNVTSVNMNEVLERVLKLVSPIAKAANIELVFESIRPVTAQVDETKLSLAIMNLVENGIKYNKESGWVHVTLNADHQNCYIEVADSGIGIPKESIDHIFERFYRVDKSHSREIGGNGLGLAIAKSAVAMHKGSINVFSQPGEGTTFTLRIPLIYAVETTLGKDKKIRKQEKTNKSAGVLNDEQTQTKDMRREHVEESK